MHEETKKGGEDGNCSYILGSKSDAIVLSMTTTTNSSTPSQFLNKLHLKQYPKEMLFFLSFFLRPFGGPDSRLQNFPKTYSFCIREGFQNRAFRDLKSRPEGEGSRIPKGPILKPFPCTKGICFGMGLQIPEGLF